VRIISRFKDYYDGALALGQDTSLTYVRATQVYTREKPPEIEAPKELTSKYPQAEARWIHAATAMCYRGELPTLTRRPTDDPDVEDYFRRLGYYDRDKDVQTGVIFFCGKQYPFYAAPKAVKKEYSAWRTDYEVQRVFSWDKEFDSLVEQREGINRNRQLGPFRDVLQDISGQENVGANLLFRVPVVAELNYVLPDTAHAIVVNPDLSKLGFQRVIDPYAAFQEISMFLGGVLGQNIDPPSPMTDKEKVKSHGFDPQYGFRTPPGKKKRKG
jgi:hypothetical protein